MKVHQRAWSKGSWNTPGGWPLGNTAQLVLVFGSMDVLSAVHPMDEIVRANPNAAVVGCSSGGDILGTEILDQSLVVTSVEFQSTRVRTAAVPIRDVTNCFSTGQQLIAELAEDDLQHVLIFAEGVNINGSELAKGLCAFLPDKVTLTGGLASDGAKFVQTLVCFDGKSYPNHVVGIGLYGKHLKIGCASGGGWDYFGPERVVTRSRGSMLFELDGEPVLTLYKRYLGRYAADLPQSALQFPLSLRTKGSQRSIVRTVLAVNEVDQSMTFAADMPEGMLARMMRANFDRLIDGASAAAIDSQTALGTIQSELAILISCVGRRLVLKQRTEEELEGARASLTGTPLMTGFYSHGEIAPFAPGARSELHNQTMTITAISELAD